MKIWGIKLESSSRGILSNSLKMQVLKFEKLWAVEKVASLQQQMEEQSKNSFMSKQIIYPSKPY